MKNIIYFKDKADSSVSLLTTLYITSLLANLAVGYRYISFSGLIQSGGIFIFPISFIISDIVTEIYGSNFAKKLVVYGVSAQAAFALYAYIIVHFPAPYFLSNKRMYDQVFGAYVQFAFASTISILLGSWINIILLSKLSEFVSGKYFAARSFISSTAGEFLVTVVSMLIANYDRLEIHSLVYMIFCCFVVKTIISFFAIWPAAIVVYLIQGNKDEHISLDSISLKNPIKYLFKLAKISWSTRGYNYNLELINLHTEKAHFFYKGSRGNVEISLKKIVLNPKIISKISPSDASHVGFYYGLLTGKENSESVVAGNRFNESRLLCLKKGKCNIESISRDNKLNIRDDNNSVTTRLPGEIYRNNMFIRKFDPTQALYIGYLSGKDAKNKTNNHSNIIARTLNLVK